MKHVNAKVESSSLSETNHLVTISFFGKRYSFGLFFSCILPDSILLFFACVIDLLGSARLIDPTSYSFC